MHPPTHGMIGWLIGCHLPERRDRSLVTAAALVPDVDGLVILGGEAMYGQWHHTFGHNAFAGLLVAAACGTLAHQRTTTAVLGLAAFGSHLVGDLLGSGTGGPSWRWCRVGRMRRWWKWRGGASGGGCLRCRGRRVAAGGALHRLVQALLAPPALEAAPEAVRAVEWGMWRAWLGGSESRFPTDAGHQAQGLMA